MNTAELSKVCKQVRRDIIDMTANAGSGHPGGSLSAVELMTSVFYTQMRVDQESQGSEPGSLCPEQGPCGSLLLCGFGGKGIY